MADQNNVVVLRVSLDEGKTEEQLKQLVLDIEKTRAAQLLLTKERKAGIVTDEQFAQQTVALRTQLKGQQQEQTALTKNLQLFRTATGELANSYVGQQAQLSLAQRQYHELEGSQNNSTESTKALSATIADLRAQLTATDEEQGLFVRNIGNYPKGESLEPLIQKLIQLQEVEKQLPAGTKAAQEAQARIGFEYGNLNKQAAAAGLTQQQLNNKVADYGERLRPASAELAKLTIAQEEVAKSAGKESEEFAKIGFQIGAARKQVAAVPVEIKNINPAAEAATKALSDTATKGLGLLGEQGEKAAGLLNKFKGGTDLLSRGLTTLKSAGETGSLGFKAIASGIALTGIGLFVIAISAVVSYFTQSAEGGKILAGVMGGLGAVVNLLTSTVTSLGKTLVEAASNPKQTFQELVDFLEGQVLNRLKAFGVIISAIKAGNIKEIANGFLQLNTGVVDVIGKVQKLGSGIKDYAGQVYDAAKAGQALALEQKAIIKARRELEIEDVKEQSRVAVLLRLSKERGKSASDQLSALKEAGRIEASLTEKNLELQRRELAAIKEGIRQKGALKAADLLADKAAKEKEIAQTLAAQDEVNAKIRVRESTFIQQQAVAAAAAAKQRAKDEVAAKQTANELALLAVEKGTAAELALKQRAIDLAADMEIAGEKKTAEQVKLIRAKAEGDKNDLLVTFQQKAIEDAKKATAAQVAEQKREYAEAEKNLTDYLATKRAEIERNYAEGKLSQNTYQQQSNALEKAGFAAALVNATDYGQDSGKIVKGQADLEIREAQRVKDEKARVKEIEKSIQDAAFEAAAQTTDLVIDLFGKESAAGQAALITKKTLAIAEIAINLQKQLAANALAGVKISAEAPPFTIPLGVAYTVATDALAIAGAAAATAKILGFQKGGVLQGPRHEEGGIPFTVAGRPGFEAEGGEVILTRGVWANPLLRPVADWLNVMGGGAPLLPRAHLALGGIAAPVVRQQLAGNVDMAVNFQRLGEQIARLKIYTKTQETMQSIDKVIYTQQQLGNS